MALGALSGLALSGCSDGGGQGQDNVADADETVDESEEELTDEEIADLAGEYINSDEIQSLLEVDDILTPVANSIIDSEFDGDSSSLDEMEDICNAVIDMDDVPECLDRLHDNCVDAAHDAKDAMLNLSVACAEYRNDGDYVEPMQEFMESYQKYSEDLQEVLDEMDDIYRRSREQDEQSVDGTDIGLHVS